MLFPSILWDSAYTSMQDGTQTIMKFQPEKASEQAWAA